MGRRLRTTVPTLPSQLDPALPDGVAFTWKEKERVISGEISDTANYNRRHRTIPLSVLSPGEQVWVTDAKSSGTVLQNHSITDLPQGVVRRNRQHLISLHTPACDRGGSPQQQQPEPPSEQAPVSPAVVPKASPADTPTCRTTFGRAIIKPSRLNL